MTNWLLAFGCDPNQEGSKPSTHPKILATRKRPYMKINEIIFTHLTDRSPENLEEFKKGSEYVSDLSGYKLFKKSSGNYDIYFYQNKSEIIGYAILEKKEHIVQNTSIKELPKEKKKHFWWLLELWIKDSKEYRRKGLGSNLVTFLKDEKIVLFLDKNMSLESFQMVSKLLDNRKMTAQIYDTITGGAQQYTPGDNWKKVANDENKIFVLEDIVLREGLLGKMIILDYMYQRDPNTRRALIPNGPNLDENGKIIVSKKNS